MKHSASLSLDIISKLPEKFKDDLQAIFDKHQELNTPEDAQIQFVDQDSAEHNLVKMFAEIHFSTMRHDDPWYTMSVYPYNAVDNTQRLKALILIVRKK